MRIIGKIFVILGGLLIGMLYAYILLGIISFESGVLVYTMVGLFFIYILGWLISIFGGRQRLLFMSLAVILGYMIYDGYILILLTGLSELTFIVGGISMMYLGVFLTRRKPKANKNLT